MSDESRPHDTDPAAKVAAELRARLRTLPANELVELAAQLTTTYVLEGVVPLSRANDATDLAPDSAGEETFAQMLKRLKAGKRDPLLERFLIDGDNISVRIDGYGVLPLTEYRRPNAPPASAGVTVTTTVRQPSSPGAATSIYNRSLYQPDAPAPTRASPQPAQPASTPAQQRAAATQQPQGQPGAAGQPKKEGENKDRFALIELD